VYAVGVPTDAEITFADHMGRFYARRYAFPPMVGRLLGYLAVCDPPEQSIGELALPIPSQSRRMPTGRSASTLTTRPHSTLDSCTTSPTPTS